MAQEKGNGAGWRRRVVRILPLACLMALLPVFTPSGLAETTAKDILVAVRTLAFVVHPPTGIVPLAIVFDPARPQSAAELQVVIGVLDGGTRVGAMTVQPVPVAVTELDRVAGFRFLLLVTGVQDYRQAIFNRTRGQGIVTISTDLECVRAALCVMGVATQPRVQVLVNRTASQAAAVEFLLAFRMMITEM